MKAHKSAAVKSPLSGTMAGQTKMWATMFPPHRESCSPQAGARKGYPVDHRALPIRAHTTVRRRHRSCASLRKSEMDGRALGPWANEAGPPAPHLTPHGPSGTKKAFAARQTSSSSFEKRCSLSSSFSCYFPFEVSKDSSVIW